MAASFRPSGLGISAPWCRRTDRDGSPSRRMMATAATRRPDAPTGVQERGSEGVADAQPRRAALDEREQLADPGALPAAAVADVDAARLRALGLLDLRGPQERLRLR